MRGKHWLVISLLLAAADQALKLVYKDAQAVVLPGVLALHGTRNTGAAFSMLSGSPWLVLLASLLLMAVLVIFARRMRQHRLLSFSLAMIFGGALGNLADRLLRGYVVDYLELLFVQFPIFNFADILITVGAGLAALAVLRLPGEKA